MNANVLAFLMFASAFFISPHLYSDDSSTIYIVQRPEQVVAYQGETVDIEVNVIRPSSTNDPIQIKQVTPPVSDLIELTSASQESSSIIEEGEEKLLQTFQYRYQAKELGETELEPFILELRSLDDDIFLKKGPTGQIHILPIWMKYRLWALVLAGLAIFGVILKFVIQFIKKKGSQKKINRALEKRRKSQFIIETEVLNDIEQLKHLLNENRQKDYLLELRNHLRDYFNKRYMIQFDKKMIHSEMRQAKEKDIWVRIYIELEEKIDQISYAEVVLSGGELRQLTRKITNQIKQSMEKDSE